MLIIIHLSFLEWTSKKVIALVSLNINMGAKLNYLQMINLTCSVLGLAMITRIGRNPLIRPMGGFKLNLILFDIGVWE